MAASKLEVPIEVRAEAPAGLKPEIAALFPDRLVEVEGGRRRRGGGLVVSLTWQTY